LDVQNFYRTFKSIAALAALSAVVITGTAQLARAQAAAAPPEKKVKDQGEFDIYNQVLKDTDPNKQIQDLDTWTQKYPDSDYKDDRLYIYIQAYNKAKQPAKVLELGSQLMNKGLKSTFKDGQTILTVLYTTMVNLPAIPNPTPEQFAIGDRAAHEMMEYAPTFFTSGNKPAGTSDADWGKARESLEKIAHDTMVYIATKPGADAMAKYTATKDRAQCEVAEAAYRKALQQFSDGAQIAYDLGRAMLCQQATKPEKVPAALYEMARAVGMDPSKPGALDAKTRADLEKYLNGIYTQYHGGDDEGFKQLKEQASRSPFPPDGFSIKTSSQIAAEKEEQFRTNNPQLALWMSIKRQLTDTGGDQYFEGSLKSADVSGKEGKKALKGTLVEGKPACRSKELLVAISDATHSEVSLKLEKPLTGKPEAGAEIQWDGVPSAFVKDPFLLTMDVENAKIDGLKTSPCAAAPGKKSAPGKKKQ
jgi:hypothetical protein